MTPKEADFDTLHSIIPGKHFYQFYRNAEDYLRVILPYFKAGILKGDACLWIVSQRIGVESALHAAAQTGLVFQEALRTEQLSVLPSETWYLCHGLFDEDQSIANAEKFYQNILTRGFKTLRGGGDAPVLGHSEWQKLHDYEAKMGGFIQSHTIIALCAYPIFDCHIGDTKAILANHDEALIGHLA
jgi:hypothetical protein